MRHTSLIGHERPITSICFNKDGDLFFTACKDGKVNAYHTANGLKLGQYNEHSAAVWSLAVSRDSERLFLASADGLVYAYGVYDGRLLMELDCGSVVRGVSLSATGELLATAVDRRGVAVWRLRDVAGSGGAEIALRPGGPEGTLHSAPNMRAEQVWEVPLTESKIIQVRWHLLDQHLLCVQENGSVLVLNAADGSLAYRWEAHDGLLRNACVDGLLLVTTCADGSARLWDLEKMHTTKGTAPPVTTYHTDRPLNACAINPLYRNALAANRPAAPTLPLASACRPHVFLAGGVDAKDVTHTADRHNFQVLICHLVKAEELGRVEKTHIGPVQALCAFPDGTGYVSGCEGGHLTLNHFDNDLDGNYWD